MTPLHFQVYLKVFWVHFRAFWSPSNPRSQPFCALRSGWGECSTTCGQGKEIRTRDVTVEPEYLLTPSTH